LSKEIFLMVVETNNLSAPTNGKVRDATQLSLPRLYALRVGYLVTMGAGWDPVVWPRTEARWFARGSRSCMRTQVSFVWMQAQGAGEVLHVRRARIVHHHRPRRWRIRADTYVLVSASTPFDADGPG
jgi:hypothetical protein